MCQIKCPVQLHFFLLGEAIVVIKAPARHFVKLTHKDKNLTIKPVLINVFYCFYKITSSKNYNVGKDNFKKKINLLIKTYLPTTLI